MHLKFFRPSVSSGISLFLGLGILSALCSTAQAYQPGDALDPAVIAKLQIDPAKITVIDFFAEWCVSCKKELPLISAVNAKADKKKVEFIGVDTDESIKVAEAFQADLRAKGALNFRTLNDPEQAIVRSFKPKGYPALYIIKDGKVARMHLGAITNIDALIEKELKALGVN